MFYLPTLDPHDWQCPSASGDQKITRNKNCLEFYFRAGLLIPKIQTFQRHLGVLEAPWVALYQNIANKKCS